MAVVKKTLEGILGEERFEKLKESRAYNWIVEAFTLNTFSYLVAAPNELLIAGMDFPEHLKIRGYGLITNTLLGRPYGMWRSWLFKKTNTTDKSYFLRRWAVDTVAFAIGQLPIYWTNMTLAGAELKEMIIASIPVTLIAGPLGIPYGWYLDKVRKSCGLPIEYAKKEKS